MPINQKTENPTRIHVDRRLNHLLVEWADGQVRTIDLRLIRQQCPCALCDDVRAKEKKHSGLHMVTKAEMPSTVLTEIIPVGNYAIQIRWEDGHDTGIYTYRFLKEMTSDIIS